MATINGNTRTCDKSGVMIVEDSNSRNCGICFKPYPCELNDPAVHPQWNCERCPNDSEYAQPYIKGEIIYMQTHVGLFPMLNNSFITTDPLGCWFLEICDTEGNVLMDKTQMATFSSDQGCGFDSYTDTGGNIAYRSAQWFNILTSGISSSCFIVRLGFKYNDATPPVYLWSEPFREVWCNEVTMLLESNYPYVDNDDNFYQTPQQHWGNLVNYRASVRVPASMEVSQYQIEKTTVQNRITSTKKSPVYLVRTQGVPEYVADQIAGVMGGQQINISEWKGSTQVEGVVEVEAETSIDKNNDEGSMWFVSMKCKQVTKIINTFCDGT